MKLLLSLKSLALSIMLMAACSQSKWTEAEQDQWLKICYENFVNNAVDKEEKAQMKDLCNCMLKVTSRKYTVEEAADLTLEQERKLVQDCNYTY
ncbi:MAG: hypothetical protein KFF73_00300 [Cyclobacteriaceae bacterium]|nr:hypothetical protein [Cyclobacteriaceae bacterium]